LFKNLMIYRVGAEWQPTAAQVEAELAKGVFLPCGPSQPQSLGWVPPRGVEHAPLVEDVGGHWLLKLMIEQRVLPGAVVNRRAEELAAHVEQATGRKPGKKALKELKEQATHELLPLAFTKTSAVRVWIARSERLLMIDAGSPKRAEEVVSLLVKALDGLALHLVQTAESPAACMSAWLLDGVPPADFSIDRDCELKAADEQKSAVRYARHSLDIEEIRQHLIAGKQPTRLAMSWRDRVSFTLTDTLQLKKIAFLDLAFEGRDAPSKDEAFDADAALATGELGKLIPALIDGLGGEHDFFAPSAALIAADKPLPVASTPEELTEAPW
jgi:recombination associated protein RdgC